MLRKYTQNHNILNFGIYQEKKAIWYLSRTKYISPCVCECVHMSVNVCVCDCVHVCDLNKSKSPKWPKFSEVLNSKNHSSCKEKVMKILQFFTQFLTDKCILMHSKYLENSFLPILDFLTIAAIA